MTEIYGDVTAPKVGTIAAGAALFRAPKRRHDDTGKIIPPGVESPVTLDETGHFSIELPGGPMEVCLNIKGAGVDRTFVPFEVPPSGSHELEGLLLAYTGVPSEPSALAALLESLSATYVRSVNGVPVDPSTGDVEIEAGAADAVYKQLARTPEVLIAGAIVRDGNGAATSAPVVWPDGSPGTYTATTVSTSFPGAVDAYAVTYGSPVTKTYTQPAVTRDISGAATAVPAIVVS